MKRLLRNISIAPINAYLPNPYIVNSLLSPPYDVISTAEARILAKDNAKSFLHVVKPEIDFLPTVDQYSPEVYLKGKENLHKFIENNWLYEGPADTVYIYCMNSDSNSQFGILTASSCKDYEESLLKTHEMTREVKVIDRLSLINSQNANSEPVLLMYRHKDHIDEIVHKVTKGRPLIDYVSDNVQHILWACPQETTGKIIEEFKKVPNSYIADGHHRSEASSRLAKQRRNKNPDFSLGIYGAEYFLTLLVPDNQLKVLEYNRVIKKSPGMIGANEIVARLHEHFEVFDLQNPKPSAKKTFSMLLEGKWIGLRLKNSKNTGDPIETIDSHLLTKYCLDPIFGIKDITNSKNIDFIGGIRGTKELEKRCSEDCFAGFALYPVSVSEILNIADLNLIMPPKSTWFEPKPRSGIAVRLFN